MKSSEFILETAIRLSGTDTEDTPAKKFIRELHADPLRKNLLDPSMTIITSTKAGFSQAELKSVAGNPTRVHISFFQAHPQKEGIGSKGMRALQDMAAEDGLSLELSVWTKGKIDTEILDKFYKDMGFKPSKGGLLVWTPANTKQVDEARKKKDTIGDCFEVAGKNMIHPQDPNIMLVHAFVSGQGPLSGKRFEHAWNEIGDEVIDNSNGRNIRMPKIVYYAIGNINPKDPNEYRSYNNEQALKYLKTTEHWGPWELGATSNSLYESADIKAMQDKLAKLLNQAQENHKLYNLGKLSLVHGVIPGPWKEIRELQAQIRAAKSAAKKSTLSELRDNPKDSGGEKHGYIYTPLYEVTPSEMTEGGWDTKVTQGTVIKPAIVNAALKVANRFIKEFNAFLDTKGIGHISMGHPTGSSAYHDVDPEETIYGDIDLQIIVPETANMTTAQSQSFWYKLEDEFVKTMKPNYVHEESDAGHPILKIGDTDWVQVDLMPHPERLRTWGRFRTTPERGIKGLLNGNMFSVLGEMLMMSIQHSGVQYKERNSKKQPYATTQKDYNLVTLTTNIETFVLDILRHEANEQGLTKIKVAPLLKAHPGSDINNVKISNLVKAIKGLAKSFAINNMYGKEDLKPYNNEQEFLDKFWEIYSGKAMKDILAKKREKADTPEAIARAEQDKQKILKGLAYVKNQFDIPGTNTLEETSSIMSLNEGYSTNLTDIEYLAQRAGYRRLGKGVDATVFIKGKGEYVIKILTGTKGYDPADSARTFIKFYRFCESNADSPYLPKFGPINKIKLGDTEQSETFYHTSMERLQPIADMNWKATNFLIRQVGESLTWHEVSQMILKGTFSYEYNAKNIDLLKVYKNPKLKEFMLQNLEQWKEIFYLIKLLKRKRGNSSWDPHRGNIMQRANGTPVIIDPWVD